MADNPAYKAPQTFMPRPDGYYYAPGSSPGSSSPTPYVNQPWQPDPSQAYQRQINREDQTHREGQQAYQDQQQRQKALDALSAQATHQHLGEESGRYGMEMQQRGDLFNRGTDLYGKLSHLIPDSVWGPGGSGGGGGFGGGAGMIQAPPMPNFSQTPLSLPPPVQMQTQNVQVPDISAAQNASFGQAKAKAGSMGQAAMRGLRGQLAERGISGSGTEARGLVRNLGEATNPLSDINVAQENERAASIQHNQDLAQQAGIAQYQGGISQRGQDIGALEGDAQRGLQQQEFAAGYGLDAARLAAQQQWQYKQSQQQQLQGLLGVLGGLTKY